jgi:flagellar hook-length control protein FliK
MTNGMNISSHHDAGANLKKASAKVVANAGDDNFQNKALSGDVANTNASNGTDSGVSSFRKVYNEIAQCNKIAQSKNGAKNGTESVISDAPSAADEEQDATNQALLSAELLKQLGIINEGNVTDIQKLLNENTDAGQQAMQIIRDAIAAITATLHLKVQDGIENLNVINPSREIVDQFAEMLSTLKGIAGVLDEAVKMNQPLEFKGIAFDVSQAAQVQQTIHEQVFKIEMALKMIGVSGDVAKAMAEMNSAAMSGIPQASDPAKLSMPVIHVKQLLGELFVSKEQKVETLLAKLAETLKKSNDPDTATLLQKIALAAKNADTDILKKAEVGTLDGQVLRKILKIDAAQATAAENKTAAQQNITMDMPKTAKVPVGKSLSDLLPQVKATDNNQTVFADSQLKVSGSAEKLFAALRTTDPGTMRQLEESVISQVADKLNVAMKTGITEIRVMLRPESLGEIQMKIRVEGDVVIGKMYVENQQVKHIVEANLQTLKDNLSQHNLTIGSFSVDINHRDGTGDQLQDLAQQAGRNNEQDGTGNGHNDKENQTDENGNDITSGIETGRKFGTNSVEYFA